MNTKATLRATLCLLASAFTLAGAAGAQVTFSTDFMSPLRPFLTHGGDTQVSDDSFQLRADGLPNTASVLFFQGTAQQSAGAGAQFGDGLRCASGTVRRLAIRTASAGFVVYPSAIADPPMSEIGAIPAIGALRYYQVWYRNSASFCTASTFNLTNGLRAQWILARAP